MARGVPALAFRYFFLQAHYRQQQTFTDEAMEAAATGYDRLVAQAAELVTSWTNLAAVILKRRQ